MKVMFATYPMAFHIPGGGEIQLLAYQKNLPEYGVDVSLYDPWNPCFLDHDIVHFFSCVGGSSHFCAFIKQLGLPLIVSSSLWITEETVDQYPVDEIRHQLSYADKIVTNSDMESETLSRVLGIPKNKFVAVYNGVSSEFFDKSDPDLFRKNYKLSRRFVLNVGNIEPRKNQLRLIEAMKSLPELNLVLIGHCRDSGYLKQILEIGGDQVIYVGAIPHGSELLRSAYSACDTFVLPSILETPGLAALEAAAQGVPVVITKDGSTLEYFDEGVFYVDPFSCESIIQGIYKAMEQTDYDNSQSIKDKYSWNQVVKKLVGVYRNVIVDG